MTEGKTHEVTDLGVFAALEEGGDANETSVVIPHHNVVFLVSSNFERVLEN